MCWSLALGQGCMWSQCLLQARSTHGLHHYLPDLTATAEVIADARLIIGASGVTISGPSGQGLPVMNEVESIP
jgi:hypothetical protein